jgi:hypothetical protein
MAQHQQSKRRRLQMAAIGERAQLREGLLPSSVAIVVNDVRKPLIVCPDRAGRSVVRSPRRPDGSQGHVKQRHARVAGLR